MAFRRPLKFVVNKNSSQAGGNSTFTLMSNDDISLIRQQAIYELAKDPVYRLLVTVQGDGELDTISDTRVTSAAAVFGTTSSFPSDPGTGLFGTVNTDFRRLRDSTDSSGFDTNAYMYLADSAPRPLCLDSERGHIVMQMPLQDVFDTLIKPALDSLYSDITNVGDSNNYMRPGVYLIGGPTDETHLNASISNDLVPFQLNESADPVFIDTVANTDSFTQGDIPTAGNFQDKPKTSSVFYLQRTHSHDSLNEKFLEDAGGTVNLPIKFETNAQKGYGYPGIKVFTRNELRDYLRRAMRFVSGGTTNYRQSYIIDSGATGNIMGSAMVNTELSNPTANFQTNLADPGAANPDDYRGQEFPVGTPAAVNVQYLKFVRH